VIWVTTEQRDCPWCHSRAGYRDLTGRESMRVIGLTLLQGTYLGALHAWERDFSYFRGLLTSGSELCCQACDRVVRVCPNCDAVSKWIDADVQTCGTCEKVFV
jgi:hypothetical protein